MRGLTKRYGPVTALDAVDLEVAAGEVVAVVGENGAGKSTLVRCIVGDVEPDAGEIGHSALPAAGGAPPEVAVVWQDLGLCDDLDVAANVFLGREPGRLLLAEQRMLDDARTLLDRLGAHAVDLRATAGELSRGERQQVALARALAQDAPVLVLDEPTASLSVGGRAHVLRLLRELREGGRALLLVSHDLDEVLAIADRILVLRHGRVVAEVSPVEVHRDDITALMSGIETESTARRQLRRLRSLVEQLSAAAPSASLPIVVSATAAALDQEMLCLHLLESPEQAPHLRRSAAVGLPPRLLAALGELPVGPAGGSPGSAAERGELVVVEDLREDGGESPVVAAALASGVRSMWSAPIAGSGGVLGTISGFSPSAGRLDSDRIELVSLYAGHAATAIEREHLFDEVSRRNGVLESLRAMLETLAGPDRVDGGLSVALFALCRGLAARRVGVLIRRHGASTEEPRWVGAGLDPDRDEVLRAVAEAAPDRPGHAQRHGPGTAIAGLPLPDARGVLVARWSDPHAPDRDALELLDDARRSLALALEREEVERARRDASAARRSQALQRKLLERLSHELRTPLTAIRGYASTLQQPDLTWDPESTDRFLSAITTESSRMERLVGDLLDSSAIESGLLRLRRDWTDLRLVLESARDCVPARETVALHVDPTLEPIWADHDRLEQVFVNLLENAVRHGTEGGTVEVVARPSAAPGLVEVLVRDEGPGVPSELAARIFEPRVRGDGGGGAGLGLAIARGIAEAHGGGCELLAAPATTFRVTLPIEPPAGSAAAQDVWELVEDGSPAAGAGAEGTDHEVGSR